MTFKFRSHEDLPLPPPGFELYAAWSSKIFFLDDGLRNIAKPVLKHSYTFWNDAGSFHGNTRGSTGGMLVPEIFEIGLHLTGTLHKDLFLMPTRGPLSPPHSMRP